MEMFTQNYLDERPKTIVNLIDWDHVDQQANTDLYFTVLFTIKYQYVFVNNIFANLGIELCLQKLLQILTPLLQKVISIDTFIEKHYT